MHLLIVGAGVAGSLIAAGLRTLPGVRLSCVERVDSAGHARAGNGLNIGPNALAALRASLPEVAGKLEGTALPWLAWRAATIEGEPLLHLPLAEVAPNHGLRIRWSDLYRTCRAAAGPAVRYCAEALSADVDDAGVVVRVVDGAGLPAALPPADLVVVAEGRFSALRAQLAGAPRVRHLGVANFRVLLDDAGALPIDDLEQWHTGPNRLLAFRLQDGLIYLSGNLPLAPGTEVPDEMKSADHLMRAYLPQGCKPAEAAAWLVRAACESVASHHWSRAQDIDGCYTAAGGRVMFVGDAAHAMAPTLGQGATLAIEDACVFVDLFRRAWRTPESRPAPGRTAALAHAFEAARGARVEFIRRASWDASDCLLAGAPAGALVRAKAGPAWRARFTRIYAYTPPSPQPSPA